MPIYRSLLAFFGMIMAFHTDAACLHSSNSVTNGNYILQGCLPSKEPQNGYPVLLVFHGGSENAKQILDTTQLGKLGALVIAIDGQPGFNGKTWENAFPWLKEDPRHDAELVDTILTQVQQTYSIDDDRIYAVGKSDGAGMAVFLACYPQSHPGFQLGGIVTVSGAYFGTSNASTFSTSSSTNSCDSLSSCTNTSICIPPIAIPMLDIHGDSDSIMPYLGQNFNKGTYGKHHGYFNKSNGFNSNAAYTANILNRWTAFEQSKTYNCLGMTSYGFSSSSTASATLYEGISCQQPLMLLTLADADHDWPGHQHSGIDSSSAGNLQLDATTLVASFLNLDASHYTSTVSTPALPQTIAKTS